MTTCVPLSKWGEFLFEPRVEEESMQVPSNTNSAAVARDHAIDALPFGGVGLTARDRGLKAAFVDVDKLFALMPIAFPDAGMPSVSSRHALCTPSFFSGRTPSAAAHTKYNAGRHPGFSRNLRA